MILLFIGGLVVGALAGIFALGLISSGHCAECRAYYDRQMEAMRLAGVRPRYDAGACRIAGRRQS